MSDSEQAWLSSGCELELRESVITDIERAVDGWDIKSERNINYRSFEPIFRLIDQYENPICQRWSCWALANLTTVYRKIKAFKMINKMLYLNVIYNLFFFLLTSRYLLSTVCKRERPLCSRSHHEHTWRQ